MPPSSPVTPKLPAEPAKIGLRERKKIRTRTAIQQHALRLFREQGYAQTSIEQIAEAAEVSPSTFFRYFPTKEDTVLSDFVDSQLVALVIDAPAELGPIGAIKHAIVSMFSTMSQEQMELESERNVLIASVPELQRGMTAELYRPIDLLTDTLCTRLGRLSTDPGIRIYAGAVVGGLMAGVLAPAPDTDDLRVRFLGDATAVLDLLDTFLMLPAAP